MTVIAAPPAETQRAGFASHTGLVRQHATAITCAFIYFLLALFATASVWSDPTHRLVGIGEDPKLFVWFLRWTPWALAHGHNPFFTHHILYPSGANLMWNTSVPLLGVLLWPVTATAGPIAAYNVAVVGCFTLSALFAFLAVRCFTRRSWPAFVGGLCYGFSPYMTGHALGHLHMLFAIAPPAVVLILHRLFTRVDLAPWRSGCWLGVLIAGQALVGEEMLAITAIGALVALLALAALNRPHVRWALPRLRIATMVAAVVAGVLLAAPLAWQFFGPERIHGRLFDALTYSTDLQSLVVPTFGQALAPPDVPDPFGLLSGGPAESGAFLLPLLFVGAVALADRGVLRRRVVLPAAITSLAAILLSLGPRLHVAGHPFPVPLPTRILQSLPVTENLVATRFLVLAMLSLSILVAVALDRLSLDRSRSKLRLLIAGALLMMILPRMPLAHIGTAVPNYFAAGARDLPEGSIVLVLPNNTPAANANAMLDQEAANMRFTIVDGYAIAPLRPGEKRYLHPQPTPWTALSDERQQGAITGDYEAARRYLRENEVDFVAANEHELSGSAQAEITAITGAMPLCQDDVCVWDANGV